MKKIFYVIAVALLIIGCTENKSSKMIPGVMTVQPQQLGTSQQEHFSGIVKEQQDMNLGFKTPGQILKIYVKEGQYIQKGQLLAQLDDKDYNLGVKAAQVQATQLEHEVERLQKLYKAKSISGNDYEKAISGLEQVRINLKSNQNKVEYTRLYAPTSGIVETVNFEEMEMVDAGTPVFSILSNNGLEVEAYVPASLYLQRKGFLHFSCTINGKRHALRLISMVPKADNIQLYKMILAFDGKDPEITSGMNADVAIDFKSSKAAGGFALPMHAVFENEGKSYVWVVRKDSTVSKVEVTTAGINEKGDMVITSGLSGQEWIVKAGVNALQNKEKVKIIRKANHTNVGGLI